MNTEPHDPTKKAGKVAENAPQRDSLPASEDGISSARDAETEANDSLKITVRTADEGRLFLEDEQAIEAGVELGISDLVHALVQISVIQDMPTHARNAVCAVALLLDQMKSPKTGEVANKAISGMDGTGGHWFVSARWLGNRGVLLEIDGDEAARWLAVPAIRAGFIG